MQQSYRKAYLTDGTQVKITEELFQQFKLWEQEGYPIPFVYSDMLKKEDDQMINASRNYYLHNMPLDAQDVHSSLMRDNAYSLDDHVINRERGKLVTEVLNLCSETQRRRFIKHYYLGFSFAETARQETCYESAVRKSVGKVEKRIISQKSLL